MGDYRFVHKICENRISDKEGKLFGFENEIKKIQAIADIIFSKSAEIPQIIKALEIGGKILLHGKPGVGKTTLTYAISSYVLNKYEIGSYEIPVTNIITSDLGLTVKNLNSAFKEIKDIAKKNGAILIFDEIDRFAVNRENMDEISELKRALIEIMDFLDEIELADKILVIGITNLLKILDDALVRRFDVILEMNIQKSVLESEIDFLNKALNIEINEEIKLDYIDNLYKNDKNCDYVKKIYKDIFLTEYPNLDRIKEKLENKFREESNV